MASQLYRHERVLLFSLIIIAGTAESSSGDRQIGLLGLGRGQKTDGGKKALLSRDRHLRVRARLEVSGTLILRYDMPEGMGELGVVS